MTDSNEQSPAEPSHEARRRNLLRLGVAAPMVLTLVPGSSFADSAAMCARKQSGFDQQRGELANKLAQTPDEWIRVQVDIVTLRPAIGEGKIEGEYVLGTDQQTWWRVDSSGSAAGPLVASAKSTPRVSYGSGGLVGKDTPSTDGQYTQANATVADLIEKRWALIRIDPNTGQPLGYSWEPQATAGILATTGCATSLMAISERYTGGFFGDGLTAYIRRVLGLT
ncbi:MAG: hypothetical protein LT106_01935 [Burkholderiaceae bacterium]|nr:hypothetical protein [Burkholderiaceae bacterium]